MKRITAALLAACMVVLGVGSAWAQSQASGAHWVYEPVNFRTHSTAFATVSGGIVDDGNNWAGGLSPALTVAYGLPCAFDSSWASGIAKFDTTAFLRTTGWAQPKAGGGVDSATVCRLFVYDAGLPSLTLGRTSATAESIYVKVQVSVNGTDWYDCAVIPGQAPVLNAWTLQTTVNAGVVAFVSSQNTGLSGKLWSVKYVDAEAAAGRKDGIDISSIHEFPLVRWILSGSRTLNHSWRCQVGHWTTSTTMQP